MKLKLKEDPKEWRKAAWMSALGLAVLSSLLRWRRVLPVAAWVGALCLLAALAAVAAFRPRWFRGYYRFSSKVGFGLSQTMGRAVLALIFIIVITPLGLVMRMLGKDPLRLRRPAGTESHWSEVGKNPRWTGCFSHAPVKELGLEQKHLFTCFCRPKVPPTNNQAERSLRPVVIMRKVIHGTRAAGGLENHSVLRSLFETARREGKKPHQFFLDLFTKDTAQAQAALYRKSPPGRLRPNLRC